MNALARDLKPRGVLRHDEPMSRHTSWRVGGPAATYFEPADRADLIAFVQQLPADEPVLWLGLGSNLLVRDGGWRGTVIALHGAVDELRLESESMIYAEAGVHCARLAKFAQQHAKAGLGFMAGIPGSVGGALAMNAGAWGGETWAQVEVAEVVRRDGSTQWLPAADFHYGYRHVEMPSQALGFLAARLRVSEDPDGEHARYTRESLARRKASQPVGKPSAGSTFRNPPGDHAARLIESCGLKGHRVGGAEVSPQHANFIIAEVGTRASDIEQLIEHIRRTVQLQTGVELHPEVRIVGEPVHA
ncbi:UDP-N-acetylmuramate dehydrogenase [Sinimarinibacterium sp. CAU 1509]|uniref:UDP-N-acetylmuramate dehydrogenase n=1 Tax=Sinimarinibacterium sp. CAU 1509 TaxID=2562283 RepID=UPI0010ABC80D|nr:UDP-N-acetylmuramate dehydrogenase [Sinimarinibacterium sp. CAU 1509]TJY65162.1 UDP-N-acetylmuramate dehydrogenase [Sinimarinibacterium sp. CAU 1509]